MSYDNNSSSMVFEDTTSMVQKNELHQKKHRIHRRTAQLLKEAGLKSLWDSNCTYNMIISCFDHGLIDEEKKDKWVEVNRMGNSWHKLHN